MSGEFELFGLDSWRSWFRRNKGHAFQPAPGQTCQNCATELKGEFCYHCGQNADTHHRTIGHLLFEAFEGLFHLDGRVWATVPALFFAPGRLARDLMEGRVARHVPPFRIFLVALLILMFCAEHVADDRRRELIAHPPAAAPAPRQNKGDTENVTITVMSGAHAGTTVKTDPKTGAQTVNRSIELLSMSDDDAKYVAGVVKDANVKPDWLRDDLFKALNNKEKFMTSVFSWGHNLALLLLPITGMFLGLLYLKKRKSDGRRFYLYDHLLVAMNLLSFIFLLNAVGFFVPGAWQQVWRLLVTLWTLANFFMTLRGGYGSSIGGAIVKSLVLWILCGIAFSLIITAVVLISLTAG